MIRVIAVITAKPGKRDAATSGDCVVIFGPCPPWKSPLR